MKNNKFIQPENGGVGGTGVHLVFGSVVNCKDSDDSFYCKFSKIFNIIIMSAVVLLIIYIIYSMIKDYFFGK